jgi:adenylate cyclase
MNTAWDILLHSEAVKTRNGTTFDIGIGVHRGRATACTIGSSERYEYTFIGDTVNTASRLDSMSKELGYRLITSEDVYKDLDQETQQRFTDLGSQPIRGKSSALHIYGANAKKKVYGDNIVQLPGKRA